MEEYIASVLKKIDNIKRLRPITQNILLNKYSKQIGVPRKFLEAYMKGDTELLLNEFKNLQSQGKITDADLKNIDTHKINKLTKELEYSDESTDDSDSDEEYMDPIKTKVNELKKGDIKRNINDYIAKNNLFSKTERLLVLLDPVLKEILNTNESKMELKELVKLY
jgi:hypothetical protein